jgi:exodeoxyribonuclease V beta subunit
MPGLDLSLLAGRRAVVNSFSGLVKHGQRPPRGVAIELLDRRQREDDDEPDEPVADALPPGAASGDVLHDVLEAVDFDAVRNAATPDALLAEGCQTQTLISAALHAHLPQLDAADHSRAGRVADLVWKTLRTALPQLGPAPLCSLPKDRRLHELEFHMPFALGAVAPAEISVTPEGFMTGWMDLLFCHADRFYLLDWKSNSLDSYAPAALARNMQEQHYDFQYRIYLQALKPWLRRIQPKRDPASVFGGIFYLYLRGMNGADASQGVHFHHPTADDWNEAKLAKALLQHMARRGTRHEHA